MDAERIKERDIYTVRLAIHEWNVARRNLGNGRAGYEHDLFHYETATNRLLEAIQRHGDAMCSAALAAQGDKA